MASTKIVNAIAAGFPIASKPKIYALKGAVPSIPQSGPPPGASIEEPEVNASGEVEYTGLTEGTHYLIALEVSGVWRYLKIFQERAGEVIVIATQATGDFAIMTAGKGLKIKEGANAKMGSATLVAGKVTVANTSVTATSRIFLTRKGAAAKAGTLTVTAKVAATSFTVESSNAEDASELDYIILEPA